MKSYLIPGGYGEVEFIEKRSRFIGRVWPVDSETEAIAHIKETREKHWDATHNVYAYIMLEGGIMRYSDDGEPGGTSGMPTLNVFRSNDIKNVCCVVTRYFGGILLGAGGLVLENTDFGADVVLEALVNQDQTPHFVQALTELTAGTAVCETVGSSFRAVRIK